MAAAATGVLSLYGGSTALADTQADGAAKNSPGVASGNTLQAPVDVPVNACGNTVDVIAALNPAFGNACANTSGGRTSGENADRGNKGSGDHGSGDQSHRPGGPGHGDRGHGPGGPSHGDNGRGPAGHGHGVDHSTLPAPSGPSAQSHTEGSPGLLSGNSTQVPIEVPVNACGNTVDGIAALNPAFGNSCSHDGTPPGYGDETPPPTDKETPPPDEETPPPPEKETTPPGKETPPPAGEETKPPMPPTQKPPALAETGGMDAAGGAAVAGAALVATGAVLYRRSRAAHRG
ncbi:chaplin [Streptomyces poriticola]|uniref:chaplin n=1 Tax=Streptomyces poriticola TaxID=3120506 RepID=UPI002FCE2C14